MSKKNRFCNQKNFFRNVKHFSPNKMEYLRTNIVIKTLVYCYIKNINFWIFNKSFIWLVTVKPYLKACFLCLPNFMTVSSTHLLLFTPKHYQPAFGSRLSSAKNIFSFFLWNFNVFQRNSGILHCFWLILTAVSWQSTWTLVGIHKIHIYNKCTCFKSKALKLKKKLLEPFIRRTDQ